MTKLKDPVIRISDDISLMNISVSQGPVFCGLVGWFGKVEREEGVTKPRLSFVRGDPTTCRVAQVTGPCPGPSVSPSPPISSVSPELSSLFVQVCPVGPMSFPGLQ